MRLMNPVVTRPANHLLLVRYGRGKAWFEAAIYAWFLLCWYLPLFIYANTQPGDTWFRWLWSAVPIVGIALLRRRVVDLFHRCRTDDVYAFDSAAGTLSHNGTTVAIRNIRKIVFETFSGSIDGRVQEIYSLRLFLEEGSRLDLAVLYEEKPVAELADQVSAFLGMKTKKEYTAAWDREGIKSLDLTQRQLDADDDHERST